MINNMMKSRDRAEGCLLEESIFFLRLFVSPMAKIDRGALHTWHYEEFILALQARDTTQM